MEKFKKSVSGYNIKEVNEFVSKVEVEYENLLNKLKETTNENISLKKELIKYKNEVTSYTDAKKVIKEAEELRDKLDSYKKRFAKISNHLGE